jgi:hypothetical protein
MLMAGNNDTEFWQLIEKQIPVRSLQVKIARHAIIDERSPFVLYAIELRSNFSRYIIKKQFENFV